MKREPLRYRLRRWRRRLRRWGWNVRRFFTLEASPEDQHLRRAIEQLLKADLQFMPWRQIEKSLKIALGEYEKKRRDEKES